MSTISRRQFFLLGLGAASVSLLAACGGQAAPSAPSAASAGGSAAAPTPAKPASTAASAKQAASTGASVAASPAVPAAGSAPAALQTVNIATVGSISDAGFYLAADRGYMKAAGLTPNFHQLGTGPQMVPLLGTGQLDVAGGSVSGALFTAIERGIPLRIVADKGSNEPNFTFAYIVARKDLAGQIKGWADLKGHKVAISATDNSGQYLVHKALKTVNLSLKDVNIELLGYPDQAAAFANKAIDASQSIEPFATGMVNKNLVAIMPDQNKAYDGFQAAVLMYGPKFVQDKPDAGKKLMTAYLHGVRDYNLAFTKGTDKDAVIQSLIKHTSVKTRSLYDKMGLPSLNPNGTPQEEDIAAQQDFFVSMGYQKKKLDLKSVLDHRFVDYAISQLGKFGG